MKKLLKVLGATVALAYTAALLISGGHEIPKETQDMNTARHATVMLFGATGTVGDGLLKAVLADPDVDKVYVVTRHPSPRIEEGVASGKAEMVLHKDYLDYTAIRERLPDIDAVYWAIGISSVGMDEETYRRIHVDFPMAFVAEWLDAGVKDEASFHYVSGGSTNSDSRMMWAREKARAESGLAQQADGTKLRVVSYRPALVTPTEAELKAWHKVAHAITAPIGYAVHAESIGQAMLEVSTRGAQFDNGTILENRPIVGLGKSYRDR